MNVYVEHNEVYLRLMYVYMHLKKNFSKMSHKGFCLTEIVTFL